MAPPREVRSTAYGRIRASAERLQLLIRDAAKMPGSMRSMPPRLDAHTAVLVHVAAAIAVGTPRQLEQWLVIAQVVQIPDMRIEALWQCARPAGHQRWSEVQRLWLIVRDALRWPKDDPFDAAAAEWQESFVDTLVKLLVQTGEPERRRRMVRLFLPSVVRALPAIDQKRLALAIAAQVGVRVDVRGFATCLRRARRASATTTEIEALLDALQLWVPAERAQQLRAIWETVHRGRLRRGHASPSTARSPRRAAHSDRRFGHFMSRLNPA